jgi:3-deoxy-manno-octulosonate cytidylyltransferase (CMP-KDO synthetase)
MECNLNIVAIIPARMGSSRFPGKPMAKIGGKPMIGHVYDRVKLCPDLTKTVVATCDKEIMAYIESIGGEAVMTSALHERASDRAAEAVSVLEGKDGVTYDIVVMVQGDEPMTDPEMVSQSLRPMIVDTSIKVVNLVADIVSQGEFEDRNCIKVVMDSHNNAMYFSREPIPTQRSELNVPMKKQVCVIPFTRQFLFDYQEMEPTPLEIIESVDMMRVLENGFKVKMVPTNFQTFAVDTPQDLVRIEALMMSDSFKRIG